MSKPLESITPARINIRGEVVHLVTPAGHDPDDGSRLHISLCGRKGLAYTEHLDVILPHAACERCEDELHRIRESVSGNPDALWEL